MFVGGNEIPCFAFSRLQILRIQIIYTYDRENCYFSDAQHAFGRWNYKQGRRLSILILDSN